ncbi:hypothetical protein LC605_17555 [Nostoc sp. CHAB 5836]|nr:hypothetical protein [Nostoc sp. CHAB 5836]
MPAESINQQAVVALKRASYNLQERNRLEGHSEAVWGVAFSPLKSVKTDFNYEPGTSVPGGLCLE